MSKPGTYTVLARRYRPQTFDDVVGQQHVAQAMRNAIKADRVAHAYLLTGARGVGKTSMARILAKALNCTNAIDGNPCNQCEICQAISTGSDVDVMEIDGASNRGIDDIRSLRANVGIRSMRTQIKMYIIDEVHMLTKEAFNALLKTLEEPPPNVKFVFCTTEPQKVPDTILSRCQRFDFSSIETHAIATRLAEIAAQENVEVSAEAVDLVARRAGGSMRDSQSLFDQLLAFGSQKIEASDVNQLLGTADDDRLLRIIQFVHGREQASLLAEIDAAIHEGVQLGNLIDQLVNCYRDLMVLQCGADSVELLGFGPSVRESLQSLATQIGLQTLTAAMQILSETKARLARVSHGRALIDLALIRLSMLEDLSGLANLVEDLKSGKSGTVTLQSTNGPAASATRSSAPPPTSASSENPIQKKTLEIEPKPEPDVQSSMETLDFVEKNESAIWTQLVERIDDRISSHLTKVQKTAIVAPNRLDIFFNSSYAFSKSYFDARPEETRKMETILREMTGQVIHVRLCLEEVAVVESNQPAVPMQREPIHKHPFVESAEAIFGATIGRADRLKKPQERPSITGEQDSTSAELGD